MNNIIITFEDGTKKEYRKGIKLGEIIRDKELTEEPESINKLVISFNLT